MQEKRHMGPSWHHGVSSGREERSGQLRHQGKTCCEAWGDAESFQLPEPVLGPGGDVRVVALVEQTGFFYLFQ